MMTDRVILLGLVALMLVTFGAVAYEHIKHPVRCRVEQQVLYCPAGTSWTRQAVEEEWKAVNCCP